MGRSIFLVGMLLMVAIATPGNLRPALAEEATLGGPEGMLELAAAAERRGDHRMAIAHYRRAQEAFPWASAPLTGWGLLAARLGAAEQAATLLAAAVDIDPDDIDAAAGLADALVDLDRLDEALSAYELVLRIDPSDLAAMDGRQHVLALIAAPAVEGTTAALATADAAPSPGLPTAPLVAPTLIDTSVPAQPAAGMVWR